MAYEFLTQATLKKLATGDAWQRQVNDEDIIDVSLNAGQLIICQPEIEESFIPFSQKLMAYCEQLKLKFPFIEFAQPQEFHSTLLTIFNQQNEQFKLQRPVLLAWCHEIAKIFNQIKSIKILFKNVILTSNGSLILTGISEELTRFRQQIYQQIPIDNTLHKNIIHITLGRLSENTSSAEMKKLYDELEQNRSSLIYNAINTPIVIRHPKFVVSKGSLSTEVQIGLTMEFNQLWPFRCY
ncbi:MULTISPECIES: hypothetical protein [Proteus]|uniref:Uncharacterized protein n=1 Tax=Proteus penneri TaxID=102862 RepID=A0ABS0W4Q3_9GAMM|nr:MULTISPECIES: hypothetical protein [Proteus]EEG86344.1 hypothetical protein PROPEN_01335 [Proteus penneri ATCC 35198]MBJ2118292.1 hypothetical protein [Proteus penneri]MCO8050980.1 hypothetical protein [Proteus penneri]MCX2587901.1 hypothetical protein [Proteus penneri]NBL77434.1 hypothetical protein [Proteus sp. G2672]